MFKRLICWIKGHRWGFWAFADDYGKCTYTRCLRCNNYKDNGKEIRDNWINEKVGDHYLIVGD